MIDHSDFETTLKNLGYSDEQIKFYQKHIQHLVHMREEEIAIAMIEREMATSIH